MFLEKINLSIQNVSDDTLIRKYEHMKLLYDQIVSCKQLFHHRYHEDTFQTLYNKYLTTKRGNQQKKSSVRVEEQSEEQEDYSQDIDFYQYQINKLKQLIEQHDHLQLEKELRQLEQENVDIKQEFEQIKEDNLYLREYILTNKLKVEEIKDQGILNYLQLKVFINFLQYNRKIEQNIQSFIIILLQARIIINLKFVLHLIIVLIRIEHSLILIRYFLKFQFQRYQIKFDNLKFMKQKYQNNDLKVKIKEQEQEFAKKDLEIRELKSNIEKLTQEQENNNNNGNFSGIPLLNSRSQTY
ncbi:hypothetical protein pb186bvf_019675 [Paramecium bursaria]